MSNPLTGIGEGAAVRFIHPCLQRTTVEPFAQAQPLSFYRVTWLVENFAVYVAGGKLYARMLYLHMQFQPVDRQSDRFRILLF